MSREQRMRLHHGLVAGCALLAVVMLAVFYSVVTGAVSHASVRTAATASAAFEATGARLPSRRPERSVLVAGAAD